MLREGCTIPLCSLKQKKMVTYWQGKTCVQYIAWEYDKEEDRKTYVCFVERVSGPSVSRVDWERPGPMIALCEVFTQKDVRQSEHLKTLLGYFKDDVRLLSVAIKEEGRPLLLCTKHISTTIFT